MMMAKTLIEQILKLAKNKIIRKKVGFEKTRIQLFENLFDIAAIRSAFFLVHCLHVLQHVLLPN